MGAPCTVCGQPVKPEESGFELEFAHAEERTCAVHVPCFHAWESARANTAAAARRGLATDLLPEPMGHEKIGGRVDGFGSK